MVTNEVCMLREYGVYPTAELALIRRQFKGLEKEWEQTDTRRAEIELEMEFCERKRQLLRHRRMEVEGSMGLVNSASGSDGSMSSREPPKVGVVQEGGNIFLPDNRQRQGSIRSGGVRVASGSVSSSSHVVDGSVRRRSGSQHGVAAAVSEKLVKRHHPAVRDASGNGNAGSPYGGNGRHKYRQTQRF